MTDDKKVTRTGTLAWESFVSFQDGVKKWMMECFGKIIAFNTVERNHRFLEEAVELVQASGCTEEEAHKVVAYVYSRSIGERHQEVGGVMVTLAALCIAHNLNMEECGRLELERIIQPEMIVRIREKQKRKPAFSPLPGVYPDRKLVQTPKHIIREVDSISAYLGYGPWHPADGTPIVFDLPEPHPIEVMHREGSTTKGWTSQYHDWSHGYPDAADILLWRFYAKGEIRDEHRKPTTPIRT